MLAPLFQERVAPRSKVSVSLLSIVADREVPSSFETLLALLTLPESGSAVKSRKMFALRSRAGSGMRKLLGEFILRVFALFDFDSEADLRPDDFLAVLDALLAESLVGRVHDAREVRPSHS
jgi:hypothetical protein